MTPPTFELRVLTGVHHRARCPVEDGAVVGSDARCDIVLTDGGVDGHAGIIHIDDDGWILCRSPESDDDGTIDAWTPFNQPAMVGPVWLTVSMANAPWTDLDAWDEETSPTRQPLPHTPQDISDGLQEGFESGSEKSPRGKPVSTGKTGKRIILSSLAILLSGLMALSIHFLFASAEQVDNPPDERLLAVQRAVHQVAAMLDTMKLSSRVQVALSSQGIVTVTGWVRNAEEHDLLSANLAKIWPMPAMRVENETEQIRRAQTLLKDFRMRYHVQYLGLGRLVVHGIAFDAAQRTAALQLLEARIAGMTIEGHDIALAQDVCHAFTKILQEKQFPDLPLTWEKDTLTVATDGLDPDQIRTLHELVASFNEKNMNIVALSNPLHQLAHTPERRVPFIIVSVVGGRHPWLMVDGGTKLLVGGTYEQYRLESIDDQKIVFIGPENAVTLIR